MGVRVAKCLQFIYCFCYKSNFYYGVTKMHEEIIDILGDVIAWSMFDCQGNKDEIYEKIANIRVQFRIKIIQNQLRRGLKHISKFDQVNTCLLLVWDVCIDGLYHPLRILKENYFFHIFSVKRMGRVCQNCCNFFLQCFRQSRPVIQLTLMSKSIEKTQTKSVTGHVRSFQIFGGGSPTIIELSKWKW